MSLRARLRRLDLFGALPSEAKESSYISLGFSAFFVSLATYLFVHQLRAFNRGEISSELVVDHRKDDREIRVALDITLFRYPCGLLSLDRVDAMHTHELDIGGELRKLRLDRRGDELGAFAHAHNSTFEERLAAINAQLSNEEGCRVIGSFGTRLVPGNFHISFHAYVDEVRALAAHGLRLDFSHRISELRFGDESVGAARLQRDFSLSTLNSLEGLSAVDMRRMGFPHSVAHHLNIVPSRFVYEQSGETFELYQYTSTMVKGREGAHIVFHLGIENVVMVFKLRPRSTAHFLAMLMALFGGLHMILGFVAALVEQSLLGAVFKRRIGKLE